MCAYYRQWVGGGSLVFLVDSKIKLHHHKLFLLCMGPHEHPFVQLGMMKSHHQHQPVAAINQLHHNCPQKDVVHLVERLNQERIVGELGFQLNRDQAVVALRKVERVLLVL